MLVWFSIVLKKVVVVTPPSWENPRKLSVYCTPFTVNVCDELLFVTVTWSAQPLMLMPTPFGDPGVGNGQVPVNGPPGGPPLGVSSWVKSKMKVLIPWSAPATTMSAVTFSSTDCRNGVNIGKLRCENVP